MSAANTNLFSNALPEVFLGRWHVWLLALTVVFIHSGCDPKAAEACERYGRDFGAGCPIAPACEDDCDDETECLNILSGSGCSDAATTWMDCVERSADSSDTLCSADECWSELVAMDDCLNR